MASTRTMKTLSGLHRAVVRASRGRIGGRLLGDPALELTTTGRRSGLPRVSMLTAPLTLGDTLVIVASKGGDDMNPAWFLNLRDDPHVRVALAGGPRLPMVARVADPEERARLWPRIISGSPHYATYQERTDRLIPVVLLDPAHEEGLLP